MENLKHLVTYEVSSCLITNNDENSGFLCWQRSVVNRHSYNALNEKRRKWEKFEALAYILFNVCKTNIMRNILSSEGEQREDWRFHIPHHESLQKNFQVNATEQVLRLVSQRCTSFLQLILSFICYVRMHYQYFYQELPQHYGSTGNKWIRPPLTLWGKIHWQNCFGLTKKIRIISSTINFDIG